MKARKILLVFLIFYVGHIQAQEIQDSVKIYFRQGYSVLEPSRRNNKEALDRITDKLCGFRLSIETYSGSRWCIPGR